MSEFGNETATAMINTQKEAIKALAQLFRFLVNNRRNSLQGKLNKEKLKELKAERKLKRLEDELYKEVGYVRAEKLLKHQDKIMPLATRLSEEQLRRFNDYARLYNVTWTAIENPNSVSPDGKKDVVVWILKNQLARVQEITARMNEDIRLDTIDDRINELEGKEELTDEERSELEELIKERDHIRAEGTATFNSENAEIIFEQACGEMENDSMTFERALNRFTDRDYSRNEPYYACERTNPSSYIELRSSREEYGGKPYTKTDYRVFNNGEEQFANPSFREDGKFTDERFKGRDKSYWVNLRADMKAKGGFSDDMVVFKSKEDFEKYQSAYFTSLEKKQQSHTQHYETSHEAQHEGTENPVVDYSPRMDALKSLLHEKGAQLEKGHVVDSVTKEHLSLKNAATSDEKLRVAECFNISKQIDNYQHIAELNVQLAMDRQQYSMNEQATVNKDDSLYIKIQSDLRTGIENKESELKNRTAQMEKLIHESKQLSGVEAARQVDTESVERAAAANDELTHEIESANDMRHDFDEQNELDSEKCGFTEWTGQIHDRRQEAAKAAENLDRMNNIVPENQAVNERG